MRSLPMNFRNGYGGYALKRIIEKYGDLSSTFDWIKGGDRTATSRAETLGIKPGDVIEFVDFHPVLVKKEFIRRTLLKRNPCSFFLFGDNLLKRGLGGVAKEMRGEPNAIGIPTKKYPNNNEKSFFTDSEYNENIHHIEEAFKEVYGKINSGYSVIFAENSIGTGLSQLPNKAPKTFGYLTNKLNGLKNLKRKILVEAVTEEYSLETLKNEPPSNNVKIDEDGVTHINIYSKATTELGIFLSNFYRYKFLYEEKEFSSIEAFWYWFQLRTVMPESELIKLRTSSGNDAKFLGKTLLGKREAEKPSKDLILKLYMNKISTNPDFIKLLIENTLPFAHYYVYEGKQVPADDYLWMAELWNEITAALRWSSYEGWQPDRYFKLRDKGYKQFRYKILPTGE